MSEQTNRYAAQIARIKTKLEQARAADPDHKVFGAKAHYYKLAPPLTQGALAALEAAHQVTLPADLRVFLTDVGDGLNNPNRVDYGGAGPYYGLFDAARILRSADVSSPPMFTSDMTDAEWDAAYQRLEDEDLSINEMNKGCAFIVSQGCDYYNALVLVGKDAGRVVNFNYEGIKQRFTFETNFLDWYERWLDEVIAGYLTQGGASWFGMQMGGDDKTLLAVYDGAEDANTRNDALLGFFKLIKVAPASVIRLKDIAATENGNLRQYAVALLLKFQPDAARPFLPVLLNDPETSLREFCWPINRYAPHLVPDILDPLLKSLAQCKEHESFFSVVSLVSKDGAPFESRLAGFLDHPEPQFRRSTIWALGKASDRAAHIPLFVNALRDDDAGVVVGAIQAAKDMIHPDITAEFPRLRHRCRTEPGWDRNNYVQINLARRETMSAGLIGTIKRWLAR